LARSCRTPTARARIRHSGNVPLPGPAHRTGHGDPSKGQPESDSPQRFAERVADAVAADEPKINSLKRGAREGRYSSEALNLVLVDFKGGAKFAGATFAGVNVA
jgi:hypothetical protein